MIKIIKRNGEIAAFDSLKIEAAILNAMKYGSGVVKEEIAKEIAQEITEECMLDRENTQTVIKIEKDVYNKLIQKGEGETARSYEGYRAVQAFKRQTNTTDESILSLVYNDNEETAMENSNKNAKIAATQRDLIAGEVSKDVARRRLIPAKFVQAHDDGVFHWHDMDCVKRFQETQVA